MLTLARLGRGGRSASYYLERTAGCEHEYYSERGQRRGRWCGTGAQAIDLTGTLALEHELIFRALLEGRDADGEQLVGPVLRADPRSRLPLRPLVLAVQARADELGVEPGTLFDGDLGRLWASAVLSVQADRRTPRLPRADLSATLAGELAIRAGLDPTVVFARSEVPDAYPRALSHVGDRVDVRRAGIDATFSAPKSVSVLFGLADKDVAGQVLAAHAEAVTQTLAYLETLAARALRGHRGPDSAPRFLDTDGLIGAAFEHVTSRAGDPQLHTHVVLANLLRAVDGRWGALDTRQLYTHALTGGYLYQAVLRGELTTRLGVSWGPVRRGVAEIEGIPADLRKLFSQRSKQIQEHLHQTGRSGPRAAQVAAWLTRSSKQHTPELTARQQWAERAREAGYTPDLIVRETLSRGVQQQLPLAVPELARSLAVRVLGERGVTQRRSTFDRGDLLRVVCETVPTGAPVTVGLLRELATTVVRDPQVVPLLPTSSAITREPSDATELAREAEPAPLPVVAEDRRYSTAELLATERSALERAAARADDQLAVVPLELVEGVLAGRVLTGEQAAMVRQLTSTGAGVQVVVGPAGAGKTAALAAARQAWEQAGIEVRGAALAAIAARTLQDGAGIPASSLTRLLTQHHRDLAAGRPGPLPAGGVLVIDEAGMVGTRQLAQLIELSAASRTKLVLVGDPGQLPEIDAGGLFGALSKRLPAAVLTSNVRQQQLWEREALSQIRDGDVLLALDAYAHAGQLHLAQDMPAVRQQIVTAYLTATQPADPTAPTTERPEVVMLASRRADVRLLNALTRDRMLTAGQLGPDPVTAGAGRRPVELRVGDQVVVTVNDYRLGLFNGTRARIGALTRDSLQLTLHGSGQDANGPSLTVPLSRFEDGGIEHGYALTVHRAQGITVDTCLLLATQAISRESGYVALSRGRKANHVFSTWDALTTAPDLELVNGEERGLELEPDEQLELTRAALVAQLETRRAQHLAMEQQHRYARDARTRDTGRSR